jgi:uncharacterized protein (DUF934 family)
LALAAGVCFKLTQVLQSRLGWQTTLRALGVLVMVSAVGFVLTGVLAQLAEAGARSTGTGFWGLALAERGARAEAK